MRSWALLLLVLPLSGCWSGESFYATAEGVAAIPAGKYDIVYSNDPNDQRDETLYSDRIKISYDNEGRAVVDGTEAGDSNSAILVKLGEQPNLFVVQSDLGASIPKVGSSLYALINVTPDGYQITVPRCDQKRAAFYDRAVVSGVLVGKPVCKFKTRADFETAMLEYAKDPISWTEYRRVRKRGE
jgi:hypothetical protein